MPPVTYSVPEEKTSPRFASAFALGCGGRVTTENRLEPGDVAMFGSPARWDLLLAARAEKRTWFYGDHGYFRRGEYYRVTRDALMAQGPIVTPSPASAARWERLGIEIKPWRRGGARILICPPGQVHLDMMRRAGAELPAGDWGDWAGQQVRRYTDRPIQVRTKDDFRAGRPLEADLVDIHAVVVYTSNVGIHAALGGIPVFALGPCSASVLGSNDLAAIETPAYPEYRHEYACSLASQQWTLEELAAGDAWRALA